MTGNSSTNSMGIKEETPTGCIGDFNGRIGELDDNYDNSDKIDPYIAIPTPNTFMDLPKRRNCDL